MVDLEIFRRVLKVVAEVLSVPESSLTGSVKIKEDLGADSMQVVTLMIALDDEFDAEFDIDDLPVGDVTIDWVCDFVHAALAGTRT